MPPNPARYTHYVRFPGHIGGTLDGRRRGGSSPVFHREGSMNTTTERRIPLTITAKWLTEHAACGYGVTIFKKKYPNGIKVTKKIIKTMLGDPKMKEFVYWFLQDAVCSATGERLFSWQETDKFDGELCELLEGFELDAESLFFPKGMETTLNYYRDDVVDLYWKYFNSHTVSKTCPTCKNQCCK